MGRKEAVRGLVGELFQAANRMRRRFESVVEPHGLTLQQYTVLRILRGAGDAGMPTLGIGEGMAEKTPGVTRLLDRLEGKGLVTRERLTEDRRQVLCRATPKALRLMEKLDAIMETADEDAFRTLSSGERDELRRLLLRVV